jgi:hypothetical protein
MTRQVATATSTLPAGVGSHADVLAELCRITGVQILGARFYVPDPKATDWQGKPKRATASWYLAVLGPLHPERDPRVMPHGVSCGGSATFRTPKRLNGLMWKLGRDESLPWLDANDGRKILGLLRVLAGVEVRHA